MIKQKENIKLRGCWRLGRDSKEEIWKGLGGEMGSDKLLL